ncbi:hypothetical protein [Fluoribacter gormanii]|uniref:hypothetical protein n=1 Tax=Fluoribacter gormanii TaxID=464 RepID=UPI0013EFA2F4|nr:hypothetical protein [Fluoribacter gormanii]
MSTSDVIAIRITGNSGDGVFIIKNDLTEEVKKTVNDLPELCRAKATWQQS